MEQTRDSFAGPPYMIVTGLIGQKCFTRKQHGMTKKVARADLGKSYKYLVAVSGNPHKDNKEENVAG